MGWGADEYPPAPTTPPTGSGLHRPKFQCLLPTFLVLLPGLGLGRAGSCRQRGGSPGRGGQRVRPSPASDPLRCLALLELCAELLMGKRNWCRVKCRGEEYRRPRDPPCSAPAEGLKHRGSHGRGRGGRPPSFLLRPNDYMSPSDTPTNCYLINSLSLPSLSSVDSQPMHSFIHSTNITHAEPPERLRPPVGISRSIQSWKKIKLETDIPSLTESGQGRREGQDTGRFPGEGGIRGGVSTHEWEFAKDS